MRKTLSCQTNVSTQPFAAETGMEEAPVGKVRMLFQAGARSNVLRAFIKEERDRGGELLGLINALSALFQKIASKNAS
jgi:hypothetical protein